MITNVLETGLTVRVVLIQKPKVKSGVSDGR